MSPKQWGCVLMSKVTFSFRKHCTLVNLFPPYNSSGIIKYYCFDVKTIQNGFKQIDIWTISPIGYFQFYVFRESYPGADI